MVAFTFAFNRMHPEFAEESAQAYKELQVKQKDKFPADIENEVVNYKKTYNTVIIYGAIFGYLIIGACLTAATSAILFRRK
jgi:hypothetical protein